MKFVAGAENHLVRGKLVSAVANKETTHSIAVERIAWRRLENAFWANRCWLIIAKRVDFIVRKA